MDEPNPTTGGMVAKAVDDVVRTQTQLSDSTQQLLLGLDQNIDLVTQSEPNEFVDALRIRADPGCSRLLQLLAGMDSEIALQELSSIPEDNKYEAVVRHLISPDGRLWLKRVTEKAKDIINGNMQNSENKK